MDFFDITFFQHDNPPPQVHIDNIKPEYVWTNSIHISSSQDDFERPKISIHLHTESDLISFVNSVKWAYESYLRRKKQRECSENLRDTLNKYFKEKDNA